MNVALIQLPHFYGDGLSRPPEHYPLGLGYLSNALKDAGIAHQAIDLWGPQYTAQEALQAVDFSGFDALCVSAYVTQYRYFKQLTLGLKERYPNLPILCGGPGPTFSYEIILQKTGAEVCVLGEGELTLVDLLHNLDSLSGVAGIAYLCEGRPKVTAPREPIRNLDQLPFPNRSLFDYNVLSSESATERVLSAGRFTGQPVISADILAGRGCPYNCHYCSKTFSGVRLRSLDNLIAEVEQLTREQGVNHLQFNDELVFVNKKRSLELCERLKPFKLTWTCQGRIDQVDEELLRAARASGCIEIGYGVESISQEILERMNKRLKVEDVVPVIKMTKAMGIKPAIQYMFGYEGENDQTLAATARFFAEIDHPFVGFSTTPIPGTRLYADCLDKGLIGDEEQYLLRLDSGYNLAGGGINLTSYSDQELARKKKQLLLKISHNYYKKRPVEYAAFIFGIARRKLARLLQ